MQIVFMDLSRHWGNTQAHIVGLALGMRAEQRLTVHICCPAGSPLAQKAKSLELPLLALFPPYSDSWWNPVHFLRLWLHTRTHRYCIFHTFSDLAARLALRVQQKRKPDRTAIIHSCHSVNSLATRNEQGEMPVWWQQLHTILCANNYVRKQLLDAGLDAMRVLRLPAGVDTTALTQHTSPHQDRCVILSIASLANTACHSVLLKTMAALWQSDTIPQWEVRIVGQCDNYQELLAEAAALGVQSRLSLLQAQALEEVLPYGHIMVSPSTSHHGSLPVMAAAWAAGLPLVCPATATNKEWAKHGVNALLYKAEDPQDLATCLKSVMTDQNLYHTLVSGGQCSVPLTTQDAALAHTHELYTHCMHKHGWVLPSKTADPSAANSDTASGTSPTESATSTKTSESQAP